METTVTTPTMTKDPSAVARVFAAKVAAMMNVLNAGHADRATTQRFIDDQLSRADQLGVGDAVRAQLGLTAGRAAIVREVR